MTHSTDLYTRAKEVMPGGVNSPVRAFNGVGGDPIFFKRAEGAHLFDEDGKQYIDYVGSWGPMILGHSHPEVLKSVKEAVENGMSFGAPTAVEVEMAEKICQLVPSIEMVRMVNSGTEATLSAIRLARGFTDRDHIIKFTGCYHGHSDSLLSEAGSGLLTLAIPSSPGVPSAFAQYTHNAPYNDIKSTTKLFEKYGKDLAAVIVEPVACNMNCVLPKPEFLQGLRELCDHYKTVLIFDEVITGFRLGLGGAQEYFGVKPDLTTLGKIIGGGMPVGAYGGAKAIMEHVAPLGPVYQAGTLSGNPVAMTAGLTTLKELEKPGVYEELERKTVALTRALNAIAKTNELPLHTNQIGSLFGLFFTSAKKVENFEKVKQSNIEHFKQFFHGMLKRGIYLAPSAFETGFMSLAHTNEDIAKTFYAAEKVFLDINEGE